MSPDDINALIDDLLILQEREDEINPHPEELPRTAEKAARLIEEWAMRLDWQQRDLERMRLLTREHGEPVSQTNQPRANSGIHESEELVQKVQQLERENAALRRDVYQCPPTSENGYEGLKWSDAFDVIEGDNAKLHNEVTALKHENLSLREARKPVAVPGLHGLVTWYGEAFQREREKCIRFEEVMQSQGDEIRRLTVENDALRKQLADVSRVRYSLEDSLTRAHNEAEACWKDKERLDWLEECHAWPEYIDAEWHVAGEVFSSHRAAIDAAIDAARKEAQP